MSLWATPDTFERVVNSPLAAHVGKISWFEPSLTDTPEIAGDWLAMLSRDDLDLRYRKLYCYQFRCKVDQLNVKELKAMARRLELGPVSKLKRADLLDLFFALAPPEVANPEGMIPTASYLHY